MTSIDYKITTEHMSKRSNDMNEQRVFKIRKKGRLQA